jgi:hypothetical protein
MVINSTNINKAYNHLFSQPNSQNNHRFSQPNSLNNHLFSQPNSLNNHLFSQPNSTTSSLNRTQPPLLSTELTEHCLLSLTHNECDAFFYTPSLAWVMYLVPHALLTVWWMFYARHRTFGHLGLLSIYRWLHEATSVSIYPVTYTIRSTSCKIAK